MVKVFADLLNADYRCKGKKQRGGGHGVFYRADTIADQYHQGVYNLNMRGRHVHLQRGAGYPQAAQYTMRHAAIRTATHINKSTLERPL